MFPFDWKLFAPEFEPLELLELKLLRVPLPFDWKLLPPKPLLLLRPKLLCPELLPPLLPPLPLRPPPPMECPLLLPPPPRAEMYGALAMTKPATKPNAISRWILDLIAEPSGASRRTKSEVCPGGRTSKWSVGRDALIFAESSTDVKDFPANRAKRVGCLRFLNHQNAKRSRNRT